MSCVGDRQITLRESHIPDHFTLALLYHYNPINPFAIMPKLIIPLTCSPACRSNPLVERWERPAFGQNDRSFLVRYVSLHVALRVRSGQSVLSILPGNDGT